jgi:hypothetical protein
MLKFILIVFYIKINRIFALELTLKLVLKNIIYYECNSNTSTRNFSGKWFRF